MSMLALEMQACDRLASGMLGMAALAWEKPWTPDATAQGAGQRRGTMSDVRTQQVEDL